MNPKTKSILFSLGIVVSTCLHAMERTHILLSKTLIKEFPESKTRRFFNHHAQNGALVSQNSKYEDEDEFEKSLDFLPEDSITNVVGNQMTYYILKKYRATEEDHNGFSIGVSKLFAIPIWTMEVGTGKLIRESDQTMVLALDWRDIITGIKVFPTKKNMQSLRWIRGETITTPTENRITLTSISDMSKDALSSWDENDIIEIESTNAKVKIMTKPLNASELKPLYGYNEQKKCVEFYDSFTIDVSIKLEMRSRALSNAFSSIYKERIHEEKSLTRTKKTQK